MPQTLQEKLRGKKPLQEKYPPTILRTRLEELLTTAQVQQLVGVTPLTARRYMRGCDLKLSHAMKLARYLSMSVHDLWPGLVS